uniref:Gamma-glutamylcyclotransferase family protein n=1 Tax=Strongyloides stercoralis TaxID=6248 RepID=A0A913HLX4_STRER
MENNIYVFVYGTLKRNEPNSHVMSDPKTGYHEFISCAKTIPKYTLVVGSQFNIPFCLEIPNKGNQIVGEVYKIDSSKFEALDELEGYPKFYTRKMIDVICDNGDNLKAWIYLLPLYGGEFLKEASEEMVCYSSKGSHGREYVTRKECDRNYRSRKNPLFYVGLGEDI